MGLHEIKLEIAVPVFDIASFTAGLYVGTCQGLGIPIDPVLESILEYGPSAVTFASTPLLIEVQQVQKNAVYRQMMRSLANRDFNVDTPEGRVKLTSLDQDKQTAVIEAMQLSMQQYRTRMQKDPGFLERTVSRTATIGLETYAGYLVGLYIFAPALRTT